MRGKGTAQRLKERGSEFKVWEILELNTPPIAKAFIFHTHILKFEA